LQWKTIKIFGLIFTYFAWKYTKHIRLCIQCRKIHRYYRSYFFDTARLPDWDPRIWWEAARKDNRIINPYRSLKIGETNMKGCWKCVNGFNAWRFRQAPRNVRPFHSIINKTSYIKNIQFQTQLSATESAELQEFRNKIWEIFADPIHPHELEVNRTSDQRGQEINLGE
jgi:hypothetical protein